MQSNPIKRVMIVVRTRPEEIKIAPFAYIQFFVKVVGTVRDSILTSITEILNKKMKLPDISPFGERDAGKKLP